MTDATPTTGGLARAVRHPVAWLRDFCGGDAALPLIVLFGLTMLDETDRAAFNVLLPNIRDYWGLNNSSVLSIVAIASGVALLLTVPIAQLADTRNRIHLALAGAGVWALFSVGTGLAPFVWVLVVMRCGSAVGQSVVFPTHNSLLSDFYRTEVRPRVFGFHRAGNSIGIILGTVSAGLLGHWFGWRAPFLVFALPTGVFIVLGLRLRDPVRGAHERAAMGASDELIAQEEAKPSMGEAYRMVWKIESLRRIFWALPFLAASLVGFAALASLQYDQTFGLDEVQRGFIGVPVQLVELVGIVYGARLATRLFAKDPALVFRFLAFGAVAASVLAAVFALAPNVAMAVAAHALIAAALAVVGPGILAALSLTIPPRARSVGFSIGALFILPGLFVIPIIGTIGDHLGLRTGMLLLTPVFLIGGLVIASTGSLIDGDIRQVWAGAAARAEMLYERQHGRLKLLLVRGLDVSYGSVQILFGVDFEIDEGEIVALLGTNGAGKSTLLKAISGVVQADRGAVIFDGRDITHAPPNEIAAFGIGQVPGGQGVFPSLTVAENLRTAGWLYRRDPQRHERLDRVFELFPVLRERLDDPAADLSGGQQQMLALSMAFLARPRLLVIDELSLGLAPVVVEQLLGIVRELRDQGTTIILVEQSVNVALSVAETAYFMEKGEIRFHGPTAELLERPDVLRSVFLEGAVAGLAAPPNGSTPPGDERAGPDDTGGAHTSPRPASDAPTAEPTDAALAVEHLTVRFGGITAVDDVSFSLARGEILGIIGPNGAGKTTVFDLVSGYTRADHGDVWLQGRSLNGLSPDRRALRGLGRSFQDARLFPSLTVEDTLKVAHERWLNVRDPLNAALRLPAQLDDEWAVQLAVDELVELLGLEAFRTKFVHELSTGSRRVVDLACVLAHRPSVVLLDEPSSGIAQRETEALGPLLLQIRDTLGASLLLIEHDMPLISSVSDRLLALETGRVVTTGPAAEVLAHPDVVASYLGSERATIERSGRRT